MAHQATTSSSGDAGPGRAAASAKEPDRKPAQIPIGDDPAERSPDEKMPGRRDDPDDAVEPGPGAAGLSLAGRCGPG
jgi:hypothetical protein